MILESIAIPSIIHSISEGEDTNKQSSDIRSKYITEGRRTKGRSMTAASDRPTAAEIISRATRQWPSPMVSIVATSDARGGSYAHRQTANDPEHSYGFVCGSASKGCVYYTTGQ